MNQCELYCVKWLGVRDARQNHSDGSGIVIPGGFFVDEPVLLMQRREWDYRAWLRKETMNEEGRELWETMWREANQQ